MTILDRGSMCCCPTMTFSVFGERHNFPGVWVGLSNLGVNESPCQLLGSVWYDTGLATYTAREVEKYTVEDALPTSGVMWVDAFEDGSLVASGVNPSVRFSITPWGGETLYVISSARGNVQKIDLTDAGADWWVDIEAEQETGMLKTVDGYSYSSVVHPTEDWMKIGRLPVFYYPDGFHELKLIGGQPLSTGGESTGWPFGGNSLGNRELMGWFDSRKVSSNPTLPGFSNTKFGALCEDGPFKKSNSVGWTEAQLNFLKTQGVLAGAELGVSEAMAGSGGTREQIAFVEADSNGTVTKNLSAADLIKGRAILDPDFLYTSNFNTPAKVLPLDVAGNDWPYGIGAFVETEEVSRHVETWKWDIIVFAPTWEGCMLDMAGTPLESLITDVEDYNSWHSASTLSSWVGGEPRTEYWWIVGDDFMSHDHFTPAVRSETRTDEPPYPEKWEGDLYGEIWFPYVEDADPFVPGSGVLRGLNWGCLRLGSGMLVDTPVPEGPTDVGYFTIDHELGYAKFKYRVTYCIGEIESAADGLPYIETTGQSYSTEWVTYYGGLGNVPAYTNPIGRYSTTSGRTLDIDRYAACGYPAKISVKSGEGEELDPIDRYSAQLWAPKFEGSPLKNTCGSVFNPEWRPVDGIVTDGHDLRWDADDVVMMAGGSTWEMGTSYEPGNLFGDLGANHSFIGGIRYFNSTKNHSPVFLVDYEREDSGTVAPTYDPVNQDGQILGYRVTPRIVPPGISWTTYQRLVFKDNVIWDSYDEVDPTKEPEDFELLESVEVLVGNRIAVLTRKTPRFREDGLAVEEVFPQKLSVYSAESENPVWFIQASTPVGAKTDPHLGIVASTYARVISCSDYWIYVSLFPLQVKKGAGGAFVDGGLGCAKNLKLPKQGQDMRFWSSFTNGGIPEHSWSNWLISLDGETTVPARIDLPSEVRPLSSIWSPATFTGFTNTSADGFDPQPVGVAMTGNDSWVSSWTVIGHRRQQGSVKWDAPRVTTEIEAVSSGTMDPPTFF